MLKVEYTEISGIAAAFRGMRNPMNSWDASDSRLCATVNGTVFVPGEKDMELASKLAAAGTDHGKFLRMIVVHCDVIAPLYWWKQMDTYKVGTVSNSCSTMHKLHEREFTLGDFSHDNMILRNADKNSAFYDNFLGSTLYELECVIAYLNKMRTLFLESRDKKYWWQMVQLLPSSYNQRRTVMLSYAVLRAIYHARKGHKLDEWQEFREWIETLPCAKQLIKGGA